MMGILLIWMLWMMQYSRCRCRVERKNREDRKTSISPQKFCFWFQVIVAIVVLIFSSTPLGIHN